MLLVVDSLKSSGGPELSTRRERGPHSDKELISASDSSRPSSVPAPPIWGAGSSPSISADAALVVLVCARVAWAVRRAALETGCCGCWRL